MRNLPGKLLFLSIILLVTVQCKKKDDSQAVPVPADYTVDYRFQLSGDYLGLNIQYYDASDQVKVVNNPALPWEISLSGFEKGDSVFLNIFYDIPPAPGTVSWGYEWDIKASSGSDIPIDQSYTHGGSGAIQDTVPISISWGAAI